MSSRNYFTNDEWRLLELSPLWAWGLIAAADGKIDKKEVQNLIKMFRDGALMADPLVREVLASVAQNIEALIQQLAAGSAKDIPAGLRKVAALLDTKVTNAEAVNFKRALYYIAKTTAEASGGFLGIFGSKISKEEQAMLVIIAGALGVS
jgi:hypothetical protein